MTLDEKIRCARFVAARLFGVELADEEARIAAESMSDAECEPLPPLVGVKDAISSKDATIEIYFVKPV